MVLMSAINLHGSGSALDAGANTTIDCETPLGNVDCIDITWTSTANVDISGFNFTSLAHATSTSQMFIQFHNNGGPGTYTLHDNAYINFQRGLWQALGNVYGVTYKNWFTNDASHTGTAYYVRVLFSANSRGSGAISTTPNMFTCWQSALGYGSTTGVQFIEGNTFGPFNFSRSDSSGDLAIKT